MATTGLKLKGFKELADIFRPGKFERRMKEEVGKATLKNALLAERAIKKGINSGKGLKPNSPFTVDLKGSSRPLVASGELLKSITGRRESWDEAVVGVLQSRMVKDKQGKTKDILQLAVILHNGAQVPVSEKMRRYFFRMAQLYERGEIKQPWFPLSSRTKVIVIPKRPFLKFATFKRMHRKYVANWAEAMERAMLGTLAKGAT